MKNRNFYYFKVSYSYGPNTRPGLHVSFSVELCNLDYPKRSIAVGLYEQGVLRPIVEDISELKYFTVEKNDGPYPYVKAHLELSKTKNLNLEAIEELVDEIDRRVNELVDRTIENAKMAKVMS